MEPNEGLIDELIRVVGGVAPPGSRKKQGGLLQSASQEAADAQLKHTNYMEKMQELLRLKGRLWTYLPYLVIYLQRNNQIV